MQEARSVRRSYDDRQLRRDNSECSSVIVSPTKAAVRPWSSHNGDGGPNTVLWRLRRLRVNERPVHLAYPKEDPGFVVLGGS